MSKETTKLLGNENPDSADTQLQKTKLILNHLSTKSTQNTADTLLQQPDTIYTLGVRLPIVLGGTTSLLSWLSGHLWVSALMLGISMLIAMFMVCYTTYYERKDSARITESFDAAKIDLERQFNKDLQVLGNDEKKKNELFKYYNDKLQATNTLFGNKHRYEMDEKGNLKLKIIEQAEPEPEPNYGEGDTTPERFRRKFKPVWAPFTKYFSLVAGGLVLSATYFWLVWIKSSTFTGNLADIGAIFGVSSTINWVVGFGVPITLGLGLTLMTSLLNWLSHKYPALFDNPLGSFFTRPIEGDSVGDMFLALLARLLRPLFLILYLLIRVPFFFLFDKTFNAETPVALIADPKSMIEMFSNIPCYDSPQNAILGDLKENLTPEDNKHAPISNQTPTPAIDCLTEATSDLKIYLINKTFNLTEEDSKTLQKSGRSLVLQKNGTSDSFKATWLSKTGDLIINPNVSFSKETKTFLSAAPNTSLDNPSPLKFENDKTTQRIKEELQTKPLQPDYHWEKETFWGLRLIYSIFSKKNNGVALAVLAVFMVFFGVIGQTQYGFWFISATLALKGIYVSASVMTILGYIAIGIAVFLVVRHLYNAYIKPQSAVTEIQKKLAIARYNFKEPSKSSLQNNTESQAIEALKASALEKIESELKNIADKLKQSSNIKIEGDRLQKRLVDAKEELNSKKIGMSKSDKFMAILVVLNTFTGGVYIMRLFDIQGTSTLPIFITNLTNITLATHFVAICVGLALGGLIWGIYKAVSHYRAKRDEQKLNILNLLENIETILGQSKVFLNASKPVVAVAAAETKAVAQDTKQVPAGLPSSPSSPSSSSSSRSRSLSLPLPKSSPSRARSASFPTSSLSLSPSQSPQSITSSFFSDSSPDSKHSNKSSPRPQTLLPRPAYTLGTKRPNTKTEHKLLT